MKQVPALTLGDCPRKPPVGALTEPLIFVKTIF